MKNIISMISIGLCVASCSSLDVNDPNQQIRYSELEQKMYSNKPLESANMSEFDRARYYSENSSNAIHWNNSKEFKRQLELEKKR